MSLGGVLDDRHAPTAEQLFDVELTVERHNHNRLGLAGYCSRDQRGVDQHRIGIGIDGDRTRAEPQDGEPRRDEGVARNGHLVAGAHAGCTQRQHQSAVTVGDADAVETPQ